MSHGCAVAQQAPQPSKPLEANGAVWRLAAMAGQPVREERDATISFGSDRRASGRSFINQYSGTFTCDDAGAMAFGAIMMTKMGGPPELMALESEFHQLLSRVDGYALAGDALVLTAGGTELLRFTQR